MTLVQVKIKTRQKEQVEANMNEIDNSFWRAFDKILEKAALYDRYEQLLVDDGK